MNNLATKQLAVSQVTDWSTRGLNDSQTSQLTNNKFLKNHM